MQGERSVSNGNTSYRLQSNQWRRRAVPLITRAHHHKPFRGGVLPNFVITTELAQDRSCAHKSATTAVNAMKASAALSEVIPLSFQSGQSRSLLKKGIVRGRLRVSPTFCAIHLCTVVALAFLPYESVPRTQRSAAALGCAYAETLALAYFWVLASGLEPVG